MELQWWIAAVEVPILLALVGWVYRMRAGLEEKLEARDEKRSRDRDQIWKGIRSVQSNLEAYKLDVARQYASVDHLKDVEDRIVKALEKLADEMGHFSAVISRMQGQNDVVRPGE